MKRVFLIWFALGAAYVTLETLWRGYSHPLMLVVGGLCGVLVGAINQVPRFYRMKIVCQSLIGAGIVIGIEFVSGCALNLWLGLAIWDYSEIPGNVMGQICPAYSLLWFAIMPLAIWAEDTASWLIWMWSHMTGKHEAGPPKIPPYTLRDIYKDFVSWR